MLISDHLSYVIWCMYVHFIYWTINVPKEIENVYTKTETKRSYD